MSPYKLIGHNYTTPDLVAKVTGRAKYAEDFRAEGMLFTRLLLSPMPHARVKRIDATEALAMPGVRAILTADDFSTGSPKPGVVEVTQVAQGLPLTNEPVFEGEPILAVAAESELIAAEAIEKIQIEFESLPFVVDALASLRPGSPNARAEGNVWARLDANSPEVRGLKGEEAVLALMPKIKELKWTEQDFAQAADGQLPMGEATDQWTLGDIEAGFKEADLVLDETFVSSSTSHQPLETRTAMAYWQNGKLYLHGSTQSTVPTVMSVARWVGIESANVVIISEYTGGGFGSKIPGSISMAIPALLSKKANAPVMMRITREEEHYIGRARPGIHSRLKVGFRKDGRITAVDMFVVVDNGPYEQQSDGRSAGDVVSLAYQPPAMRWRGLAVLTNTPPKISQRSPGGLPGSGIMEPILAKAARLLGIDQVAIRKINAPAGKAQYGPTLPSGRRNYSTSCFMKEALDKGAEIFDWDRRRTVSGKRQGSKVRGVGVALGAYSAGSMGFDGLLVIQPDGRVQIQSGIGNLGSHAVMDVHRVAAELIDVPWEKCDITWGNSSKHLPWTCSSGGSSTLHAMSRAAHAAGMDARQKLQAIAARELGGAPADYEVANERVFNRRSGRGLSLAEAARLAIKFGGVYDGHELPDDINNFTRVSATALAGRGLLAVARDNYPRDGQSRSFVAAFAEVEVDVETGAYRVLDFTAVADCGTVINPRSLGGQILGGISLGMGHVLSQKWIYDQHYGVALAKRFYENRPVTILDYPETVKWAALDIPDPETPVGARGIGEPPVGAGYGAVMNALADALGDEVFRRSPVMADMILTSIEAGKRMTEPLTAHI